MAEYLDSSVRLDGFAKALLIEPSAVGYIIGYAQCLDITEYERTGKDSDEFVSRQYRQCDPMGTGGKIARREQSGLLKLFGIASSRVVVIDGGYRNSQMVELWIVPPGKKAPEPTPTAYGQ